MILYHKEKGKYEIVDGQQRIITLSLLKKCLDNSFENFVINKSYDKNQKDTLENIHKNYLCIKEILNNYDNTKNNEIMKVLSENLESVVIIIDKNAGDEISEVFQLFDSQNSRGKDLNPHDLLIAYHLREMNCCKFENLLYVEKWEENDKSSCDMFGNICLVSSDINSKFSNASPKSKKENIRKIFDKQSIKLQKMAAMTDNLQDLKEWKNLKCAEYQEEKIKILKDNIIMEN